MPIYEFDCQECGRRFERLSWKYAEPGDAPITCACGGQHVQRVEYSRSAVQTHANSQTDGCAGMPDSGCCNPAGMCCRN